MCTYRLALKDGAKVQGWQKSNSGIAGLGGDKRGYGRIKGDAGLVLVKWEGAKRRTLTLFLGENWGEWGNKKATASVRAFSWSNKA